MKVIRTIAEMHKQRRLLNNRTWGLVPTMGYLHEGHLGLVRRARAENEFLVATIFVNPTQFAPNEDFKEYPRDEERDLALLERAGVDFVFVPEVGAVYPPGFQTTVTVSEVTQHLEGASRPTHFAGVTTVVAKLFNIVKPERAYFGQKDAQQVVVIKRMALDLNYDLEIVVCPTVRESDGLAMSSRNARLSTAERAAAPVLFHALSAGKAAIEAGERNGDSVRGLMARLIDDEPLVRLDYVSAADPETLREVNVIGEHVLLSGAIFVGIVRLIDNMPI